MWQNCSAVLVGHPELKMKHSPDGVVKLLSRFSGTVIQLKPCGDILLMGWLTIAEPFYGTVIQSLNHEWTSPDGVVKLLSRFSGTVIQSLRP